MKVPKQVLVERDRTHRLIPYRYSDRGRPVLDRIAEGDDDLLRDLTELVAGCPASAPSNWFPDFVWHTS